MREDQSRRIDDSAEQRGEMERIEVADRRMSADAGAEPDEADQDQRPPQSSRRGRSPHDDENRQAGATDAAAETRSIMSDERHQARIQAMDLDAQIHERQILRHKNARHADDKNGQAAERQPCGGDSKKSRPTPSRDSRDQRRVGSSGAMVGADRARPSAKHGNNASVATPCQVSR